MWPRPGTVGSRDRGWASWGVAGWPRGRSTSRRSASSAGRRARATARLFCPAGAAQRAAPPHGWLCRRSVCRAPAGCPGCWSVGQGRERAARGWARGLRRRSKARGARLWAGETSACGRVPPRSKAAIFGASLWSFLAGPPWRAVRERAWPRTTREARVGTAVREPVPGEQPFDGDDEPLSRRGNGRQKGRRLRCHVAVQHDGAALVHEADGHRPGMEGDATGWLLLCGVKSPEGSSLVASEPLSQRPPTTGAAAGGASISITALQLTADSLVSLFYV